MQTLLDPLIVKSLVRPHQVFGFFLHLPCKAMLCTNLVNFTLNGFLRAFKANCLPVVFSVATRTMAKEPSPRTWPAQMRNLKFQYAINWNIYKRCLCWGCFDQKPPFWGIMLHRLTLHERENLGPGNWLDFLESIKCWVVFEEPIYLDRNWFASLESCDLKQKKNSRFCIFGAQRNLFVLCIK